MPGLRIDYIAPVLPDGISGRSKASREKAAALQRIAPGSRSFFLPGSQGRLRRRLGAIALEAKYLLTVLRHGPPDAVVTRSALPWGALLVRLVYGVPVFKEMHADLGEEAPAISGGNRLVEAALRLTHRADIWSARHSDGIIFNHRLLQRHVEQQYLPDDIPTTTVPNGCDPAAFRMLDRNACRQELGLSANGHYLVWVGTISPWHGVDTLPDLADQLPDDYEIIVVGPTRTSYATRLVGNSDGRRLTFPGAVPPDVAMKYMNAADACLLPVAPLRVSPGSALKLYDYAACGAPIICQEETDGYSDVVLGYGIGIAVDFYDPASAADAITAFLPGASSLRPHIRSTAVASFSWDRRMEEWARFVSKTG